MKRILFVTVCLSCMVQTYARIHVTSCRSDIQGYIDDQVYSCDNKLKQCQNYMTCSNINWSQLPDSVSKLQNVKRLIIRGALESVPSTIGQMKQLTSITLQDTYIKEIPIEIAQLKKLNRFEFQSYAHFKHFPQSFRLPSKVADVRIQVVSMKEFPIHILHDEVESLYIETRSLETMPLQISGLKKLTSLTLKYNGNKPIPDISGLQQLEMLTVENDYVGEIPSAIGELKNLRSLLWSGPATGIPIELAKLNLEKLTLSYTLMKFLPRFILDMSVETLILKKNQFEEVDGVPKTSSTATVKVLSIERSKFTSLEPFISESMNVMKIRESRLQEIPRSIMNMQSELKRLDLSENIIETLPTYMGLLSAIQHLSLAHNNIDIVPTEVLQLSKLSYLDLENNKIKSIPEFGHMESLTTRLALENNQLEQIPESIAKLDISRVEVGNNKLKEFPIALLRAGRDVHLGNNLIERIEISPEFEGSCDHSSFQMDNSKLNFINETLFTICQDIEEIYLNSNELMESSLPGISHHSLEYVELRNNLFTTLPASLPSADEILMDHNLISSIEDISAHRIHFLVLHHNHFAGEFNHTNLPSELYHLDLAYNQIESISEHLFEDMTNLAQIDLSHNRIRHLPSNLFSSNVEIASFNVQGNPISSLPNGTWNIKSLSDLDISQTKIKELPSELLTHPLTKSVHSLNISYSLISNVLPLENFDRLSTLDLSGLKISSFPNLSMQVLHTIYAKHLNLGYFPQGILTDTLKKLSLSGNRIEYVPNELFTYKSLETIDLSHNRIHSFRNVQFDKVSKVEKLDLSFNQLNETSFYYNIGLFHLRELNLRGNSFTSWPSLGFPTSKLHYLDLRENPIASFPSDFITSRVAQNLHFLYLPDNLTIPCEHVHYFRLLQDTNVNVDYDTCGERVSEATQAPEPKIESSVIQSSGASNQDNFVVQAIVVVLYVLYK